MSVLLCADGELPPPTLRMLHPPTSDIDRWLRSLDGSGLRTVAIHLLTCDICRQHALAALGMGDSLSDSFERTRARVLACAADERQQVDALLAELAAHPPARRQLLVANGSRYRSPLLARRLLEASRDRCAADPADSEALARLALAVVGNAPVSFYGERLLADLTARAWSLVGNARRAANDRVGAERAFERGQEALAGSGDPLELAGFDRRLASLRRDQGRYDEARDLLTGAAAVYGEIGDEDRLAVTLCSLGLVELEDDRPELALEPLLEAVARVDPLADPRTAMTIHHNLGISLCELGRFAEAARHYRTAKPFYARFDDRPTAAKARWLESLLAAGRGEAERAERLMRQVMAEMAALDRPLDAALAAIDLAAQYARRGDQQRLTRLGLELQPLVFCRRFDRPAAGSLAAFLEAAAARTLDLGQVKRARGALRRARTIGSAEVAAAEGDAAERWAPGSEP